MHTHCIDGVCAAARVSVCCMQTCGVFCRSIVTESADNVEIDFSFYTLCDPAKPFVRMTRAHTHTSTIYGAAAYETRFDVGRKILRSKQVVKRKIEFRKFK